MTCIKNVTRGCCFGTNAEGEATAHNCPGCHKLEVFDWMADLPNPLIQEEIFEIQFKNTRKGYYQNGTGVALKVGDIVAVEATPGHDIGIVTLTGDLVTRQMKKGGFNAQGLEFKKIYRKAKPYDIEKWQEAIGLEHSTMIRSRQMSSDLGLNMKIGDVEYQGDRLKAIFYYIADERVDFRELIKVLADQFKIRVEMRQIGARQEAGRIGGIAACGRELCCSTWMGNFSSVTIGAARNQEISLNPQKLAGQCGKLKCCLNYELDTYIDARRSFPRLAAPLEAMDGNYHLVKSDIFSRTMWFSPDPQSTAVMIPISVDRVKKIVAMNRRGEKIDTLADKTIEVAAVVEPQLENVVGQESITRFDPSRAASSGKGRSGRNRNNNREGRASITEGRTGTPRPSSEGAESTSVDNAASPEGNRSNNNRNRNSREGRNGAGGTARNRGGADRSARPEQKAGGTQPARQNDTASPRSAAARPDQPASASPEKGGRQGGGEGRSRSNNSRNHHSRRGNGESTGGTPRNNNAPKDSKE